MCVKHSEPCVTRRHCYHEVRDRCYYYSSSSKCRPPHRYYRLLHISYAYAHGGNLCMMFLGSDPEYIPPLSTRSFSPPLPGMCGSTEAGGWCGRPVSDAANCGGGRGLPGCGAPWRSGTGRVRTPGYEAHMFPAPPPPQIPCATRGLLGTDSDTGLLASNG